MADPNHVEILKQGVAAWNEWRDANPFLVPDLSGLNIYAELNSTLTPNQRLRRESIDLANVDFRRVNLTKANFHDWIRKGANLSGADLQEARLERAALMEVNLEKANLRRADLSYAALWGSNLAGADLHGADLSYATLWVSNLAGADLREADLSSAEFWDANLAYANLAYANLSKVDFASADLTGATLTGTEPWKAYLYASRYAKRGQQPPVKIVRTIEAILDEIQSLKSHHNDFPFYFRGESRTGWALSPSIMRNSFAAENESKMLLDLISRLPDAFSGMNYALEKWVLARHHTLNTRFLDITKNPMVALFNACRENLRASGRLHVFAVPDGLVKPYNSDTVSIIANFARLSHYEQYLLLGKSKSRTGEDYKKRFHPREFEKGYSRALVRLYQFIREEKPHFEPRLDPKVFYQAFVIEPQQSHERIRAQSGAFLASAFHERFEQDQIQQVPGVPFYHHYQLTVPAGYKNHFMEDLASLNITQETMFPGLDSSAAAITRHYSGGG